MDRERVVRVLVQLLMTPREVVEVVEVVLIIVVLQLLPAEQVEIMVEVVEVVVHQIILFLPVQVAQVPTASPLLSPTKAPTLPNGCQLLILTFNPAMS